MSEIGRDVLERLRSKWENWRSDDVQRLLAAYEALAKECNVLAAKVEAQEKEYERGRAEEYQRTVQERERWDTLLAQAEAKVEAQEKRRCHNVRGEDGPCDCAGCRDVGTLLAQIAAERAGVERYSEKWRVAEAKSEAQAKILRDLTPGGSEFQTADECAGYIRQERTDRLETIKTFKRRAGEAEAKVEAQDKEIEHLKDRVENLLHRMTSEEAAKEIERLRGELWSLRTRIRAEEGRT